MRSVNVKFHEFIMHRIADMNISLLYFFEFFTLEEQELERTTYMKDVILYEAVPTKSISSFLELYFIFYEFSNFRNGQVQEKLLQTSSLYCALYAVGEQPGYSWAHLLWERERKGKRASPAWQQAPKD
jgi:hypothetical protein